jgi:hypothetical protein
MLQVRIKEHIEYDSPNRDLFRIVKKALRWRSESWNDSKSPLPAHYSFKEMIKGLGTNLGTRLPPDDIWVEEKTDHSTKSEHPPWSDADLCNVFSILIFWDGPFHKVRIEKRLQKTIQWKPDWGYREYRAYIQPQIAAIESLNKRWYFNTIIMLIKQITM